MDSSCFEVNEFTCKHCSNAIASLDHVPIHSCFLGKQVYMENNNILYTEMPATETLSISSDASNILSSEENQSPESQNPEPRLDLNQNNDETYNIEKSKKEAVWTKNKTLALLSLYEANMNTLDNPRKKTKIWDVISRGLQDLSIEMTTNQVRWRMNYLMKKYKECVDNNLKSGRGTMTFEFFDEMENIFGCKKAAIATYSISSNLPLKVNNSSSTRMEIQSPILKKQKTKDFNKTLLSTLSSISSSTSTSISASISTNTSGNTSKNFNSKNKENEHAFIKSANEKKSTTNSQQKNDFNNFWMEYMQKEEKRREERDENMLKAKKEELKFKKHYIEMREKELDVKKTVAINKIKSKEKRHDEILEIEKLKCNLLKKLLSDKEQFKFNSDSE